MRGESAYREFGEEFSISSKRLEGLIDYGRSLGASLVLLSKEESLTVALIDRKSKIFLKDDKFMIFEV